MDLFFLGFSLDHAKGLSPLESIMGIGGFVGQPDTERYCQFKEMGETSRRRFRGFIDIVFIVIEYGDNGTASDQQSAFSSAFSAGQPAHG